jgi:uncharacterized protein
MNPLIARLNRKALCATVAGSICLIGSCAPLGNAAWHTWRSSPARVLPLSADAPLVGVALQLTPARHGRIALVVVLQARATATATAVPAAPVNIKISDAQGRQLLNTSRTSQAVNAHRSWSDTAPGAGDHETLHYDFPKFMVPADGRIVIDAQLNDAAQVGSAELVINDDLGDYAVAVNFGVFMLLAGWIAAVVGGLSLLDRPAPPGPGLSATREERNAALRGHLLGLLAYPLPFAHLLVMAAWWWRAGRDSAFVEEHGREALNFQLSILVYLLIAFTLSLVLIGVLMLPLVLLFQVVMTIEAAVQARAGHRFRYPLTFRFLRAPSPAA